MRNQRLCRFSTARAARLISSASEAFRTQGQLHHAGKDSWQRAETAAWPTRYVPIDKQGTLESPLGSPLRRRGTPVPPIPQAASPVQRSSLTLLAARKRRLPERAH